MFAQANNMLEELLFLAVITGGQNAYQAFESAFCTLGQLCDRYGFECRIIGSGINGSQLFGGLSDGDAVIFVPENEDLSEFFGELAETFQCDVKQNRTLGNLFEMKFQDENGNNLDIDLVLVCENPIDGVVDAAVDDRCIVSLATECPELQSAVMPLICDKFNRYYAPFDGLATQDTKYFITFNETSQELMTGMMEMLRADQILWAVFCFLKIWMRSGILPPISTAALACAVVGGYNAMSVNFSSRTDSVRKMFVTMAGVLQFLRAMSKLVTMDAHFDDEGRGPPENMKYDALSWLVQAVDGPAGISHVSALLPFQMRVIAMTVDEWTRTFEKMEVIDEFGNSKTSVASSCTLIVFLAAYDHFNKNTSDPGIFKRAYDANGELDEFSTKMSFKTMNNYLANLIGCTPNKRLSYYREIKSANASIVASFDFA
jgi:hypothetical protein